MSKMNFLGQSFPKIRALQTDATKCITTAAFVGGKTAVDGQPHPGHIRTLTETESIHTGGDLAYWLARWLRSTKFINVGLGRY